MQQSAEWRELRALKRKQIVAEATLSCLDAWGDESVAAFYAWGLQRVPAQRTHLERLRGLGEGIGFVQEFGTEHGFSAAAWLLSAERVRSWDVAESPLARVLEKVAGERWEYCIGDSREAPVVECDLLYVDSEHTFATCDAELRRHADAVRKRLVFHDTVTFGSVGEDPETHEWAWTHKVGQWMPVGCLGIRPAIDALMVRDPSWRIVKHWTDQHGMLVLERR